jgi:hypothetical protein
LNLRLPAPKAGALPVCATPRYVYEYYFPYPNARDKNTEDRIQESEDRGQE